jgi:hypothetical protein
MERVLRRCITGSLVKAAAIVQFIGHEALSGVWVKLLSVVIIGSVETV